MSITTTFQTASQANNTLSQVQADHGCWPVMLTPFDDNLQIDFRALDALVEWYIAGGAQGLFACCLSSEMFHLSAQEKTDLVERVCSRVSGRVPVVAAGAFSPRVTDKDATGKPQEIADAIRRVADTGVAGVVLCTNQFGPPQASSQDVCENIGKTLSFLPDAPPLGLYECPVPYKRVLTPEAVRFAAQTGAFYFLKDTCCDMSQIKGKIAALQNSPLRFYNANTGTLLASLRGGGMGFSGVGANAIPHLYAWMCRNFEAQPQVAQELQNFFDASAGTVDDFYPHLVKNYLSRYGMPMRAHSRLSTNRIPVGTNFDKKLRDFHDAVEQWEKNLRLASPFGAIMS